VERIGTLKRLRRYPVKGMAGEDIEAGRVTFAGLLGDRVYAFVDAEGPAKFPWMTGRKGRDMILFRPRLLNELPLGPEVFSTDYSAEVVTPEGETARIDDPAFTRSLEERYNRKLGLRHSERSMMDTAPVSVMGLATVRALSEETGMALNPLRFRTNFYVEWENDEPYFEDGLVGKEILIGECATIRIVKKDQRCIMITLDPETAEQSPVVFETVARNHSSCLGVYGAVLREGIVRANDAVYLIQAE